VHVQFIQSQDVNYGGHPAARSPWLYAIQPQGVQVTGNIQLRIKIPPLYGSTNYAPPNDTPVLIIGLDANSQILMPAGTGTIQNGYVVSDDNLQLNSLDYLSYSLMDAVGMDILKQYRAGDLNFIQFQAALTEAVPTRQ
jgi:hypothetical protein